MAIKKSLKWIFIGFNTLFAVIGIVICLQDFRTHYQAKGGQAAAGPGYLTGGLVAGFSILGVYGAYKEKKHALNLFSVFLGLGMAICLVVSVMIVISRSTDEVFTEILDGIAGIFFGLALVALIGITMAVSMVCQIKDGEQGPGVMAVPTFDYSTPPPAYSDIYK